MPQDQMRGDWLLSPGGDGERILKRKSPGSCGERFEDDAVAEGVELGTGRPDSHPSWRPPAMAVLSAIQGSAPCGPLFSQVIRERQGPSYHGGNQLG
jgi:hypothetical protein